MFAGGDENFEKQKFCKDFRKTCQGASRCVLVLSWLSADANFVKSKIQMRLRRLKVEHTNALVAKIMIAVSCVGGSPTQTFSVQTTHCVPLSWSRTSPTIAPLLSEAPMLMMHFLIWRHMGIWRLHHSSKHSRPTFSEQQVQRRDCLCAVRNNA